MPDPTPTPTPPPAKAKQTRGDLDQKILADLKLAEDVAAAAKDADHAAKLADEGLPAPAAAGLLALAAAARDLAGKVVTAKQARLSVTQAEEAARDALLVLLRDFQQRAKRLFASGDPKRAAYGINKENFGRDREGLEQDAENIIKLATADALPGLKPEKLTAAAAALAAWKKADQDQHKAGENQGKLLGQLDAKMTDVNARRRDIQLAADTAWPPTDAASAPLRRAFKLPVNQPIAK